MRFEVTRVSIKEISSNNPPDENALWDAKNETWYIEIKDVNDILLLVDTCGVIISSSFYNEYDWVAIIYDDYYE